MRLAQVPRGAGWKHCFSGKGSSLPSDNLGGPSRERLRFSWKLYLNHKLNCPPGTGKVSKDSHAFRRLATALQTQPLFVAEFAAEPVLTVSIPHNS